MNDIDGDAELIEEFVVEAREALDVVDESLLSLESSPNDLELVREIFRRVHSLKGAAGFLGFELAESVSHAGESLLSKVRDGELTFSEDIASALMETVDALRSIMDQLEKDGSEGQRRFELLLDRLRQLREGGETPTAAIEPEADSSVDADVAEAAFSLAAAEPIPEVVVHPAPGKSPVGQILLEAGMITDGQLGEALSMQQQGDPRRIGELLTALGYTTQQEIEDLLTTTLASLGGGDVNGESKTPKANGESSIRVDIDLLDGIVGLVGELVLTRNQIVQATDDGAVDLGRMAQELAYITSSLQEQALRTRMQRIENAWRSLPRVVRDVSKATEKPAVLEMSGEGIELDRTIIEAIRDPLVHLVRNAVDHGLESPEARQAAGKPEVGVIRLSAIQDGGHVIIEVADDGGGIDPHRVAQSALDKKLISQNDLATMTEAEMVDLVLLPGFSTASKVTKISGRGVGMDVVASNLKAIRGSIEIRSKLGVGTAIRLAIPLTLAIVPALVVSSSDQLFAIPQASVVELVRLQGSDLGERVEWIHSAPVLRLREQLLPLIELADVLEMAPSPGRKKATIIVVQSGDQPFGLIVDHVTKAEEIVVKPVSRQVQSVGVYAGATVMGDGSASLILDVSAIARQCNFAANAATTGPNLSAVESKRMEPVLTVMVGQRRIGLPTADLERLEKVDPGSVEWSGSTPVVQYRGRLLPLVFLNNMYLEPHGYLGDRPLRVVVTSERADVSVGLVVDHVLDVLEIDPSATSSIGSDDTYGAAGSVVANGVLTELLDIPALLQPFAYLADHAAAELPCPTPTNQPAPFAGSAA